jgi:hypothetical protein
MRIVAYLLFGPLAARAFKGVLPLVVLLLAGMGLVRATPIAGVATTTGSMTLSALLIDFLPAGAGNGTFTVSAGGTGSFAALGGTAGVIKDLSSASVPVGTPISLADFMTFAGNTNLHITLTMLNPGIFTSTACTATAAIGQTCTPAGSPFNFTNTTANSSTISFSVQGLAVNSATAETSSFAGTVSGSFPANYQALLGVLGGGGSLSYSYSMSIAVTAPPPVATLDIDASITATKYDALTDGLITIRYLFGLTGTAMTSGALGATATRTDPVAIKAYLDGIRTSLDIDGNGASDALTDGLLILRYLFGLRGSSLIAGVVDPAGTRTTSAQIEAYLLSLMP